MNSNSERYLVCAWLATMAWVLLWAILALSIGVSKRAFFAGFVPLAFITVTLFVLVVASHD